MNQSKILQRAFEKAYHSKFYLRLLNLGISRFVPFNKPHRFKILIITSNYIKIELPYIKRNLNHIKGIHACALATLNELTSGLLIISRLDPNSFRIIMKRIEIDYKYQAKQKVFVEFTLSDEELLKLKEKAIQEPVEFTADLKTFDFSGSEICQSKVTWQLKSWNQVKTKS